MSTFSFDASSEASAVSVLRLEINLVDGRVSFVLSYKIAKGSVSPI